MFSGMASLPIEPSSALERVVAGYAKMVRSVIRQRGLSETDLDEVLQDVRIRLWRALPSGERIAGVNTSYVYRVAMSAACDLIRRRRSGRLQSIDDEPGTAQAGLGVTPPPDEAVERMEMADRIELAIGRLGAAQRPVVRMYLAGYNQAEIQSTLGWTEPKTRNVLYRGLQALRDILESRGIGPGAAA